MFVLFEQDELGSVLSSNVPSRPESRTKIVSAVSKMEPTEEDVEREAARMAEWNCGKASTGAHHPEEIKQETKTDKSLLDGRPPMDSMSCYDRFVSTEDLTSKRSLHRTVAKDSEYGEELPSAHQTGIAVEGGTGEDGAAEADAAAATPVPSPSAVAAV